MVTGPRRQLDVLWAQRQGAAAAMQAAHAQRDRATLDLDYTVVTSPIDGAVGDRALELGDYV